MKGMAWAAPVAVAGIAAPAFAVSYECSPQTAGAIQSSFAYTPTTNNVRITNWDQTRTPASAPEVRFATDANGVASAAFLIDDPTTTSSTTTTLLSPTACLGPGTYTFSFNSSLYNANTRNVQLTANVLNTANSAVLGNTITFKTTTASDVTRRTNDTIIVKVVERTQIRFRYRWIVDEGVTSGTARFGDDIGVTAPQVRKTA
jgi:hypothetical protein